MKLTEKQSKILQYITKCLQEQGYPPTIREIAEKFSFDSTGTVRDHLKALTDKGVIKRIPGVSRGLKLIKRELLPSNLVFIPIVGHISAGGPKLAFEDIQGNLAIDKTIITAEGTFALRVEGDSMMGKGILKGDYVVVKPQPMAQNGDIVVALIEDEATVKEFRRKNGSIKLLPANPIYQPIDVDERVKIIGRVVGLIRKF